MFASSLGMLFTSTARAGFQGLQVSDLSLGRTPGSATSFYYPRSIAVDPLTGKVYVCDSYHHRVLRFPSSASLTAGTPAEAVFGQADMNTVTPGLASGKMKYPTDIVCDSAGRLWVADGGNSRILRFDAAATKASGVAANGVLGQTSFTSSVFTISSSTLVSPSALAIYNGDLYVADTYSHRVLRFANAAAKANGAAAQTVFGQPDMTTSSSGASAAKLYWPSGIAIQPKESTLVLWVADSENNRVVGFEFSADVPLSVPATKVLGQTNFSDHFSLGPLNNNLRNPSAVAFSGDSLYICDRGNGRILRWDSPDTKPPGSNAAQVYGQPDFFSRHLGASRHSQPADIFIDPSGALWVADSDSDRVLRYNSPLVKGADSPADLVLWQTSPAADKIMVSGIAIDPISGKVFVAESMRNRVLRYASYASLKSGGTPEAVLGQPDLTDYDFGNSASRMYGPSGILCSPSGRLWVTDTYNNRILRFDNAAAKPSGSPADGVLGEATFGGAGGNNCTPSRLLRPTAIALHSSGVLWVADSSNNRVLRFDNAHEKPNGANADGLLGQPGYYTATPGVSNCDTNNPAALAVSPEGHLWVLDCGNNRILRFENAAAKPVWGTADGVLGQPDFASSSPGLSSSNISTPSYGSLALDAAGRLYVGEQGNYRIVWFNAAAQKPNGAPATWVLGQSDLDDNVELFDNQHFGLLRAMTFDPTGALWIADGLNDRVLRFSSITPSLSSSGLDGNKRFFMNLRTSPFSSYQIESSADLKTWTPLGTAQKATYNSIFWIDNAIANGKKFYRAVEIAN